MRILLELLLITVLLYYAFEISTGLGLFGVAAIGIYAYIDSVG